MTILKQWFLFSVLTLTTFSALASPPLVTLVLPNRQEIGLDEAMLAALPQTEFKTATPWTQGVHHYRGPTLESVLKAQGITHASQVFVSALNGYQQSVDLSLFEAVPLVLARHEDGQPMNRRNKGPLWLLMSFSDYPKLNVPRIHNCMVWQVVRIEVID